MDARACVTAYCDGLGLTASVRFERIRAICVNEFSARAESHTFSDEYSFALSYELATKATTFPDLVNPLELYIKHTMARKFSAVFGVAHVEQQALTTAVQGHADAAVGILGLLQFVGSTTDEKLRH